MGIKAWFDVWCDEDDCVAWTHGGSTRDAAMLSARANGWRSRAGKWYCPDHTPTTKIVRGKQLTG